MSDLISVHNFTLKEQDEYYKIFNMNELSYNQYIQKSETNKRN